MFGAEANVRVLRELARHGGELTARSLVARTGLAQSSVREALVNLSSTQIVETLGSRRSQLFRLHGGHPLADAVAAVFEAEERRFDAILTSVRAAAEKAGAIVAAWLYGSVTRGDDRPDSDFDIAVVTEDYDLQSVEQAMQDALSPAGETLAFRPSIVVIDTRDVMRLIRERDPWWRSATRDNIPLIGERPETLEAWLKRQNLRVRRGAR
jgi:predicted nucleotidyltransferase